MVKSSVKVTHVIFDVDGTLLDTEICYTMANQAMLKKYGREFTADMQAQMMGRGGQEANAWLLKEVGISDQVSPENFAAEKDAMLAEMFPKCQALPGAERLVRHFARKQVPMAICSGSCWHKFVLKATNHHSWLDLIPIKVLCGDDKAVKRGKPFPDAFLETMRRFAVPPTAPHHVLVFEDSPNGGKAAKAAGMQCVMVPDAKFRKQSFELNVSKVLSSLEEFVPEEFGLPPFD
ncbi:Pseudouridine-5'-monophosphatase [Trichostrongylus colubriformis]|uniref:Pseudouridine-5'-monophosphatase n=1 Tax=Trichostrongylus colubriformis TaxID=6319 RepID=A0AAN8F350_TRICO